VINGFGVVVIGVGDIAPAEASAEEGGAEELAPDEAGPAADDAAGLAADDVAEDAPDDDEEVEDVELEEALSVAFAQPLTSTPDTASAAIAVVRRLGWDMDEVLSRR